MELKSHNVDPYGALVQQLGDLQVFRVYHGRIRWFTSLDEAVNIAISWYSFVEGTYKQDCEERRNAIRNLEILKSPQAR